ncbi:class I SAM-dependent methyltransferase [Longitalea luteola]|uniref:class I SAM-dependent methyltransferase n=1 Tax=Longitalea luteola TaxID=2812563 RepID=UPI001A969C00|nr:class I SAM-dependent methyltransferase [Longitalea luteola]
MSKATPFDVLAGDYDAVFTGSLIGEAQRRTSHTWLRPLFTGKTGLQVLEINCGTGADACWMAEHGHFVTATDGSPAMIDKAKQRSATTALPHPPVFITAAFDELQTIFHGRRFDRIVSNFAGLNCISPPAMKKLSNQLQQLLQPGGYLAVVVFGKYCWWDTCYYLLKARPRQAFRRWTNKEVVVPLSPQANQPVYYYSIKNFARLWAPLQLVEKKPVGLCIPPSWMEAYMQQHLNLFQTLVRWEEKLGSKSVFTSLADHAFLLFKKDAI